MRVRGTWWIVQWTAAVALAGCIDTPEDTDACVRIETARCALRARCLSDFDEAGCRQYYKEVCRTRGFSEDPGEEAVDACIADIDALVSPDACAAVAAVDGENELCVLPQLTSCVPVACTASSDGGEASDTGTDGGAEGDTGVPEGLNPY